jgi:hypothetical protein
MQSHIFDLAQDFIWRNARLIDRYLFAALFQQGPKAAVITALKAYQNPDGGFGGAIEPDMRAPNSQPIYAETALHYLNAIDALSDPQVQRELLIPLCGWLQSVTTEEGGIPFVLPTANDYPHTPWMGAPDDHPPAALNPTASVTGLLRKGGVRHAWLERAVEYCWRNIEASLDDEYHTIMTEILFLQNAPNPTTAAGLITRIIERIRQPGKVELDPNAGGYVHMPLDWASQPDSPFRVLFDTDTLRFHLNRLAKRQQADGGWPITWDAVSPGAEMECRVRVTINALSILQAYHEAGIDIDV